jgi:hypothetical protein
MRYMIIVKATGDSEAGVMPEEALFERMQRYHEELARAGMLVDASGLKPTSYGWRVRYEGERATVVDGPFTETKELIAGYTIIEARSREEALEWTRRFPNPAVDGRTGEIEVRPFYNLDELGDSPAIARFRELQKDFTSAPT